MIPQLTSRSFSVAGLYAAPFIFVSPAYQRPFAWGVDEAERLLNDIQTACAASAEGVYFLGAFLLVCTASAEEQGAHKLTEDVFVGRERAFEIVDGQQRIVTLAILLAVLRDLLGREAGETHSLLTSALLQANNRTARVLLRGPDSTFLNHCISEPGACLVPPLAEVASDPQRRLLEIRDFFARQLRSLERNDLIRLANFVFQNCAVVAVVTNTIDRAFQMFTVLNDAGKPLTRNDILKAELIGQTAPADRDRAIATWEDLERRLGKDFEQLFSYVRILSGRGSVPIVEAIHAQVATTPGGAASFLFDVLWPAGQSLDMILHGAHSGAAESAEINKMLRYIAWPSGREWVPPLLAYCARHGKDAAALLNFLRALDRFAFVVRMQGLSVDKRAQKMSALTSHIRSCAPSYGPWPPLQLGREELRSVSFNLRDLHRRSPQVCRLVMLRINEHLGASPMPVGIPLTVEHILPLKIAPNSQWRSDFPDPDARAKLATCIGNLTLVSAAVNERASNHDFARKVDFYFDGDAEPISHLTAELKGLSTWTALDIDRRLKRLTGALNEIWQLG